MLFKYLSIIFLLQLLYFQIGMNETKAQQKGEQFVFYNKLTLDVADIDIFEEMLGKLLFEKQLFKNMQVKMHAAKERVIFKKGVKRFSLDFDKIFNITAFLHAYQKNKTELNESKSSLKQKEN